MAAANLTQRDIEAGLRQLGLGQGDIALMHSSLASMGWVEDGANTVLNALLNVLGPAGTLVVPIFGDLGVLTQIVENHPHAVRSIHPLAAVAAIGKEAAAICRDHWRAELAHGPDTPYACIADLGGWVLLLGVDQDRSTTLHTVEELLRLPYLRTTEEKTFETPSGPVTRSWPLFPGPHRDFIGSDALLRASGKMTVGRIGSAVARLIRSRDLIDILVAHGRTNPAWALCNNPNCADCVAQLAALRHDRLAKESFRLAAGSRLAGRYVPEIIENLTAAGITAVELDLVQGRPACGLGGRLAGVCDEFRAAGIAVSALRTAAVTENDEAVLDNARAAGVTRLVLPLSGRAGLIGRAARDRQMEVSFFNVAMSSEIASQLLLEMQADGLKPRFTFSAAGFARAGEEPFLKSYKRKLRRFVDQLDVADATFEGASTPLAGGNAEIKEMISILRCAGFDGWFTLTSGGPDGENLRQTCDRFMRLLDQM
jgi:aminoglycoside 3-N-acetyltransferase